MDERLAGKRVLVVEDKYFLADDMAEALTGAGAEIVGPAGTEDDALKLIDGGRIDLAVIDIDLRGSASFRVADALAARGVPFVFATGYDAAMIPERHARVPRWEKPFHAAGVVDALAGDFTQTPASRQVPGTSADPV